MPYAVTVNHRISQPMANRDRAIQLNSIITGIAIVIIAVLLAWLSVRYPYESDWTRGGRYTLSEASQQVLSAMHAPLEITAYVHEQQALREAIQRFIRRYQRNKPDIALHFINPYAVPEEARNLGININGELVLRYQGKSEHVRALREEDFTNALQRLLRGSEHWLAFVEGHGERDPLGKTDHDIGQWAQLLSARGFRFQPINLTQTKSIPDNTSLLVLVSPMVKLLPGEVRAILDYVSHGGNLLWLLEPNEIKGLEPVADYLGIKISAGTVIDFSGQPIGVDDPSVTLVTEQLYGAHPAVAGFTYTTLFPKATAINITKNSNWNAAPILTSGNKTWQETGEISGELSFDEDSDIQGPLTIGVGLTRNLEQKQQRVVVIGDGDFLSNTYLNYSGNRDLGVRLINWLSSDDDFIAIPSHTAVDTQFSVSSLMAGIIGFGFLILLPMSLFGAGAFVWWRRKNL